MVIVVAIMMVSADLHCFFCGEVARNNALKWVMNTGTHKFGVLTFMAVIEYQNSALEMAWGPSYENVINKKVHFR